MAIADMLVAGWLIPWISNPETSVRDYRDNAMSGTPFLKLATSKQTLNHGQAHRPAPSEGLWSLLVLCQDKERG
jgi:hypothetical protein